MKVEREVIIKCVEETDKTYQNIDGSPIEYIVRCKDCKHWASAEDYDCEIHSGAFGADDFCSYGERKGGEDE